MDAQKFLAEFGHIANAPGGIARLRELILQFAISGRLVEQKDDDTCSSDLIEANKRRKRELIENKELKRIADPRPVQQKEFPWELPKTWSWVRLGAVTNYGDAPKIEFKDVTSDTWVLELEDIEKVSSKLLKKVFASERKFKSTKNGFPCGAVLYGKLRPYLDKVLIADTEGVCSTEISPISFYENINANYLRWYLKSPFFISYADGSTYGMNLPRLGTDSAREALFPFPPLEEQSRIVTKVDELMALCDQLEAQQQERRTLQNQMRQATLQAVAASQSPHELKESWQRLQVNFAKLFSMPEDVEALRSTILDLAIAGYLSEESIEDERVVDFIERNERSKQARLNSGEMKRKKASSTDVYQLELETPDHWAKIVLEDLFQFIDYRGKTPTKTENGVVLVTAKNVRPRRLNKEPIEYISKKSYQEWMTRGFPKLGDLLFTTEAPLGNVARIEEEPTFALAQRVINFQPFADLNTKCAMYFMLSPIYQNLLDRNSTGMTAKGIKAAKLKQLELPIPPIQEQQRIVNRIERLFCVCDELESSLSRGGKVSKALAIASVSALTGIAIEQEEEPMKAPQTELLAPVRLGTPPDVKAQAPLATILARHNGEMIAKDLWQRFGGDIDVFYAQLKTEVAHGWILEPKPAEMREKLDS